MGLRGAAHPHRLVDFACPTLQGKATGLIGWLPSRAVTFVDNHDTGSTQQHWPFPAEHVVQGYAYILTHPGAAPGHASYLSRARNATRCACL